VRSIPLIASGAFALLAATAPALAFEPIVVIGGQAPVIHPGGGTQEILATAAQTDGQFGMITTLDAEAGSGPGGLIVHEARAEMWYVLEGEYTFTIDGQTHEGGPGTFVAVPAGTPHEFVTKTPDAKLLMFYTPGGFEQFFMAWDEQGLEFGPELGVLEASHGVTRP
jgi:mannose-6-phosphate isomerase-like protein (cupin superfamily)